MDIRAFFALPLKQSVVRRLADHADTLCHLDAAGRVQWVDSDNYHLTLCFLGNLALSKVNSLEQLAGEKLAQTDSFQLHLDRGEYYRVSSELALLAALAEPQPDLMALRKTMVEVINAAGIHTQQQNFKPHVTLGRLSAEAHFRPPERWPALDLLCLADEVVLYQSKTGANGSIYTPLFKIPLGVEVQT